MALRVKGGRGILWSRAGTSWAQSLIQLIAVRNPASPCLSFLGSKRAMPPAPHQLHLWLNAQEGAQPCN